MQLKNEVLKDPVDKILSDIKPFDNYTWREIINKVCHLTDTAKIGIEAISPFGFEELDKKYLKKQLRRYYCYVGIPNEVDCDLNIIAQRYRNNLLHCIAESGIFAIDDIVIITENQSFLKLKPDYYDCRYTDKLIDIQVRHVKKSILDDYAEYLMASLAAHLLNIGEASEYATNQVRRRRYYQLYIIQEKLFGRYTQPMTDSEKKDYEALFCRANNALQLFFNPELLYAPPDTEEMRIIQETIKPRVQKMHTAIRGNGKNIIKISSNVYHCPGEICLELERDIYDQVYQQINNNYLNFI